MTNTQRSSHRIRRRRVAISAAVGLSAVAAVPVFAELTGAGTPAVPTAGPVAAQAATLMQVDAAAAPAAAGNSAAALAQGKEQLAAKQYEEALATLQQAKADDLDAGQRADLDASLKAATEAAGQRRQARAAFEQGEKQLAANDKAGALASYAAAKNNAFADAATAEKANTQMAVAVTDLDLNGLYASAKSDFDGGNLDAARSKFAALDAVGYKTKDGKAPGAYVAEIQSKQAAPTAVTAAGTAAEARVAADAAPAATVAPMMNPGERKQKARAAYVAGRDAYHRGDMAGAKANFQQAADLGYQKGFGEVGPQKMLAELNEKEQADVKRMARANREADQMASAAPVVPVAVASGSNASAAPTAATPNMTGTQVAQATPAPAAEPMAPTPATGDVAAPAAATPAAPTAATPAATDNAGGLSAAAAAERIRAEQNAWQASQYVKQAKQAQAAGQYSDALRLYDDALALDKSNSDAQQGRVEVQKLTGTSPAQTDLASRYITEIERKKSSISFSVQAALEESRQARAQGDFAASRRALIRAQTARDTDPGIFTQQEIAAFDSGIRAETSAVDAAETQARTAKADEDRRRSLDAEHNAQLVQERERQSTIASLVKQSRQLTQQGRNQDALKIIDQILTIDPRNDYAQGVRPLIYDRIQLGRQRKSMEDITRNTVDVLNMAEEQRIPIPDLLTYPTDWPDLSAQRDATTARERGGVGDQATEAILAKQLPELRFDGVPFTDVIDFLRDTTQANIFVNWTAIEGAGVDKNAPITTRLTNVKFSKVLEIILDSAGGGVTRLGYTIDDGVITISTQDDLAKNVATRTYDIRDLLVRIPNFAGPTVTLSTGGGGRGGGGGQGLFSGSATSNTNEGDADRQSLVEQITQLIKDTIASDSWKDNGGLIGAVQELGGQLIVTQTPENQTQIARLLEQLRETRAIQVNVEARFLTVQRNFLEEVGVDFDFQFNAHYDGATDTTPAFNNGTQFSPVTVSQNSVTSGSGGFTGANNLAGTGVSTNLGSEAAASNYGLSTGINAFLDDFRASLFLRAVQLGQNATTLTAPKLTLFNGQQAFVAVNTTQSYVSDLVPVVSAGAVGFTPTIQGASSGVVLSVQATVSADRKYVTLTLTPTLQRLISLTTFTFATGQTIGTGTGGTGGGTSTAIAEQIQLPNIEQTQLSTTVSVPDRGTLLLGGQTLMGEVERESGVPVLSKIPFLKRLFTNRGTAKDEQILLILVKPTIIIQREIEQNSFPLLESSGQK